LMQYPVFPYVLSNYTSQTLDLSDSKNYRNLSKPIAVQEDCMASAFSDKFDYLRSEFIQNKQFYKDDNNGQDLLDNLPPYHYSSLYSNSGIVLHFLVRVQPFTKLFLDYQDNNFDIPDRSFHTIETTYKLSSYASMTDVKELIPEFYYWPEFLMNQNCYNFGYRQCNELVNHVNLPKWADGNTRIFIKVLRQALESEYTRANLHHWIDLIFGVYQRPTDENYSNTDGAVSKLNCYHPAVYKASLKSNCPLKQKALLTMVKTYGQIPKQMFPNAHSKAWHSNELQPNFQTYGKIKNIKFGNFIGMVTDKQKPVENQLFALASKNLGYQINSINHNYALPSHCALSSRFLHVLTDKSSFCYTLSSPHESNLQDVRKVKMKLWRPVFEGLKITLITHVAEKMLIGTSCGMVFVETVEIDLRNEDFGNDTKFRILTGHHGEIKSIETCVEQNMLVTGCSSGRLILWDLTNMNYIRKLEAGVNKLNLITIFPRTGDILHCAQNSNSDTNEPELKLRLYNINGGLDSARQVSGLKIHSICVSNLSEGQNMNAAYLGVEQAGSYAVLMISSWDLRTLRLLSIDTKPVFMMFEPAYLVIADEKKLFVYVDMNENCRKIASRQANKIISEICLLPFWLLNPGEATSLKKYC